jgi:hypothetical protein
MDEFARRVEVGRWLASQDPDCTKPRCTSLVI